MMPPSGLASLTTSSWRPAGAAAKAENVKNALSRHGNRILEGMPPEERRVAEIMFRRLVEVEDHSNRLRRPTQCGTVARLAQVSLEVVQRVVDAFRAEDASFIYASRRRVTDDTSIDIMHESLIRQWDTLDRWVRREKASYEVYNDLCRAAQRMGEGAGTLLTGLALSRAQHWLYEEQPTRLWARRYGGDFDAAIRFLTDERGSRGAAAAGAERGRGSGAPAGRGAAAPPERAGAAGSARPPRGTDQAGQGTPAVHAARDDRAGVGFVLAAGAALASATGTSRRSARVWRRRGRAREARPTPPRASACRSGTRRQGGDRGHGGLVLAPAQAISRSDRAGHHHRAVGSDAAGREDPGRAGAPADGESRAACSSSASRPQPIVRAVGLRWPDAAREIVKQRLAYVASDAVRPQHCRSVRPRDLYPRPGRAAAMARPDRGRCRHAQARKRDQRSHPARGTDRQAAAGDRRNGRGLRHASRPGSDRAGAGSTAPGNRGERTEPIPPAGVLG